MVKFVNYSSVSSFSFAAIFLSFLSLFITVSSTEARNGSFSIELIHVDSSKSPFYNPNIAPDQRLRNAIRRSVNRLNRFDPKNSVSRDTAQADIIPNFGDYLMNLSIGTPPVEILAEADTGSDLIWTQCNPCPRCFKQVAPLFVPENSSTYKDFSCPSMQCAKSLNGTACSEDGKCLYSYSYAGGSFTNGNLATDTITLGSTTGQSVPLPETTFGCGHYNGGRFNNKTTGIVGLGGGDLSLTTQIGASTGGKFSYCLVPFFSQNPVSSKINFGVNGIVSGSGVVSTPLTVKDPKTFYFLTLEAITVEDKRIVYNGSSFTSSEGNIIIDSGTTLTFLPEEFKSKVLSAVSSFIQAEPIPDSDILCYDSGAISKLPNITVNFKGADLKLSMENFILRVKEITCFTFIGSNGIAIYGNLIQGNFLIGYDIEKKTVSFKPTDCAK